MPKIRAVYFRQFRSLSNCDLTNCANLNVLIGKNNSGKSNVLAGIEAGLAHLKTGQVASIWPTRGRIFDEFTHRNADDPLQIGFEFEVPPEFGQSLREQLQKETVGLEFAIDQLKEINTISVVIGGAVYSDKAYRYVQEMDCGPIRADGSKIKTERASLFRITNAVAMELMKLASDIDQLQADLAAFNRVVAELPPRSYLFRDKEAAGLSRRGPTKASRAIDAILKKSSTPEEFDEVLGQHRSDLESKIEELREQKTLDTMKSFSGEVRNPPEYLLWVMQKLGETALLHFRETRPAIGADEASQLLQLKTRRGGTERLGTLQRTVKALLGVNVDAFEPEVAVGGKAAAAEMDIDDFLVEANGAGIREALRIILDLEMKAPSLALIERA